jgi:hypothetical protein
MEDLQQYGKPVESIKEFKKVMDNLYKEMSKTPKESAVKVNKYANNSKYLEIGYIEMALDRMFISWDWTVQAVQSIANGIVVTGTLTVTTVTGQKITRSGVAGVEIQTKAGSTELNPSTISSKALDRDPGRAEAYALKNAAAKLGNAFGRSLNREFKFEHIADVSIADRIFNTESEKQVLIINNSEL